MRLTEIKVCYPQCDKQGNLTKVDYIEIKDKKLAEEKLCQLEDIEDELGIDLITLFNVLKDKKVWVVYAERISRFYITNIDIKKVIITGEINIGKYACFEKTYNIKDYGKTWALTKEELE